LPEAKHSPESIIDIAADAFLDKFGKFDFLVAGHEYWLDEELVNKFEKISDKCLTYQHASTPQYGKKIFDNKKHFLFCYSDQFCSMFKKQKPTKLLCASIGYDEEPVQRAPEDYLVSIGRVDKDKSPHYAVLAAEKLGMPIYLIGESVRVFEGLVVAFMTDDGKYGMFAVEEVTSFSVMIEACHVLL
jgi:hypothetical protein